MDGMLSQEEINALLGNVDADSTSEEAASDAVQTSSDISKAEKLTPEESDALGEISNTSMGTAQIIWRAPFGRRQRRCRFWLITGLILQLLLFPTRH